MKISLVMIEWIDSRQPDGAWRHLAGDHDWKPVKCASVGWLLADDADKKVLAPNMGDINDVSNIDDDEALQFSGAITIPTRCVVTITELASQPEDES